MVERGSEARGVERGGRVGGGGVGGGFGEEDGRVEGLGHAYSARLLWHLGGGADGGVMPGAQPCELLQGRERRGGREYGQSG